MGRAMTLVLRQLAADDIERLAEMESENQPRPWSKGVFGEELARADRIYVGAFSGDSIFGFAGAIVANDEAHVTNLLVAPDQRRKGLARQLMLELIDRCIAAGSKHLTLEVRSKKQAAIDVYRGFGLAPVGVRKGYYGDDDALVLWAYDIDSAAYALRLETLR